MEIATIGFTQSSAQHFLERLKRAGVRRLLDVRLNNVSQLAGFAKSADLAYFVESICSATYEHDVRLAPTQAMLSAYRKKEIAWSEYEFAFRELMLERRVPVVLEQSAFEVKTALLCSEHTSDKCHRRIVAELLAEEWKGATIEHL